PGRAPSRRGAGPAAGALANRIERIAGRQTSRHQPPHPLRPDAAARTRGRGLTTANSRAELFVSFLLGVCTLNLTLMSAGFTNGHRRRNPPSLISLEIFV